MTRQSFGNSIVLEAYKQSQGVNQEVRGGFAFTRHKNVLIPLKVLVTAQLSDGTVIPAGTTAYLKDDALTSEPWARDIRKSESLGKDIVVGDISKVAFFEYEDFAEFKTIK